MHSHLARVWQAERRRDEDRVFVELGESTRSRSNTTPTTGTREHPKSSEAMVLHPLCKWPFHATTYCFLLHLGRATSTPSIFFFSGGSCNSRFQHYGSSFHNLNEKPKKQCVQLKNAARNECHAKQVNKFGGNFRARGHFDGRLPFNLFCDA